MAGINYQDVGVDRKGADLLVEKIAILSKATLNRRVRAAVGGYASVYELDKTRWIAASTDGVGTKLKLAGVLKVHDTVGIDLVAMSVNDLLCVGAEPLFFLDYFATGRLELGVAESVLRGIVTGCKQARCALVGGETAEMPDFYTNGEYDLAGFAVGVLAPKQLLPSKSIRPGDALVGIGSTGPHSNGYSLLRKLLPEGDRVRAQELLTPTRIYVRSLLPLMKKGWVKGLAHITGSGFLNVPRINDKLSYQITLPPPSEIPSLFQWIRTASGLSLDELVQTFNMGVGMVVALDPKHVRQVVSALKRSGEKAWLLGEVVRTPPGKSGSWVEVRESDGSRIARLRY